MFSRVNKLLDTDVYTKTMGGSWKGFGGCIVACSSALPGFCLLGSTHITTGAKPTICQGQLFRPPVLHSEIGLAQFYNVTG